MRGFTVRSHFFVASVVLVSLLACQSSEPTKPSLALMVPGEKVITIDEHLANIALDAPEFGGMYWGDDGRLNVWLVGETTIGPSLRRSIEDFLAMGTIPAGEDIATVVSAARVLPAKYGFATLVNWHSLLTSIMQDRGVTQTDVDDIRNALVIGVTNEGVISRIRAGVSKLGIPGDAFLVEVIPPMQIVADLQGVVRPVPSSVQIAFSGLLCTLGWNAYRRDPSGIYDGQRYFFTCSHCTDVFGQNDTTQYGQPTLASPIGVEVIDPPMVTSATDASCPVGDRCRYSDAAVARYDSAVAWNLGRIPTVTGTAPFTITGYRDIGNGAGEYDLLVGRTAYKTGRTTGTTSGTVTTSCVRTRQFESGVPTDRVMLCQMQASGMAVGGGDSGSPVYLTDVPGGLHLVGIMWGTADTLNAPPSPVRTTFSRWYLASLEVKNAAGGDSFVDIYPGSCNQCGY